LAERALLLPDVLLPALLLEREHCEPESDPLLEILERDSLVSSEVEREQTVLSPSSVSLLLPDSDVDLEQPVLAVSDVPSEVDLEQSLLSGCSVRRRLRADGRINLLADN
jgi:hypothetical protein